ncbi:MAG TPA: DHA2 family efflux MFS transporter permease subunit [Chloroflexota bacterium]|nr:DHA2 family efflux MFS transporter permease subunit [Chloroflexota bacterium]
MAAASLSLPAVKTFGGVSYKWTVLMVTVVGMFMSILDQTVVNVALPKIISVFGASIDSVQLVVTGYALALAIIIPATSYLQDTFGSKRMWMFSLAAFTIGSTLCGLSWNTQSLIVFRVLQGLGGGMLQPLAFAMIYRVVPPAERGFTMGLLGIPLLVAPAIGPALGGWLVEFVDWRTIFMINVPIGALGLFMSISFLRESETKPDLKFDLAGFLTAAVAFSCSLVALSNAPQDGWTAPYIVVLLIVSVIFFAAWIVVELRTPEPLLDLRLFQDGTFTVGAVVLFVVTTALFGASFLLPLFLQEVRGLGALETGLLLLPQGVAAAVIMPVGGKLFDKIGARPLLLFGLMLLAVATWIYISLDVTTPNHIVVLALILRGASLGFIFMPLQTAMLNRVPLQKISSGSSLTSAIRQLFASFGIAVVATVLTSRQTFHQAVLAERVTAGSPVVQRMTAAIGAMAAQHGWTLTQAKGFFVATMDGQVAQRASVMAFDDAFLFLTIMCIVAIIPTLFLGRGRGTVGGPGGAGATPILD